MKQILSTREWIRNYYGSLVAVSAAFILTLQPALAADTIWTRFSMIMKDIYS